MYSLIITYYKIRVAVTAAGNEQYEVGMKTVTVKVKVK